MGASVIYQALEETPWISKDELRGIVEKAVNFVKPHVNAKDFLRYGKITRIMSQYDVAFDSVCNLLEIGVIRMNKEEPIDSNDIGRNINILKGKIKNGLSASKSKLYQELIKILDGISASDLTWKVPLASRVISDDSILVQRLSEKQKKKFMKPKEEMVPKTMPSSIEKECNKFIMNFITRKTLRSQQVLSNDGHWKENDDKLTEIALKILDTLRTIWCNPAFGAEFVESLNEGTYVNNVIVSTIQASLLDNPFGEHSFITTFEKASAAAADRKKGNKQIGRRPDIMFVSKEDGKFYELMYVECSRIICTDRKEDDDNVKLWRESNDGMFWAYKSRRLEKGFSIIGVQVAGCKMRLNILIRDDIDVHRYYKLRECSIPIRFSNDPSVLIEFIKTLLVLRNILIVNMSILRNTPLRRSSRNIENSSTVSSD